MGLNRWGCSRLRQLAIVLNFPRISQMCQGLRRLTSWTSTSNPVVAYPSTWVRKLRTRKQHLLWNRERMSVYTINMMATKIILLVFLFFSSYLKIPKWRSNWKGWDNKFSWWHTDAKASETSKGRCWDARWIPRYGSREGSLHWREFGVTRLYRWDWKPWMRFRWENEKKPTMAQGNTKFKGLAKRRS